jgi:hypothetical protein
MTIFICIKETCPNKGITYDFGDDHPVKAECGGCKATLLPEKEAE